MLRLADQGITQRLLLECYLTLDKAVEMAKQCEQIKRDMASSNGCTYAADELRPSRRRARQQGQVPAAATSSVASTGMTRRARTVAGVGTSKDPVDSAPRQGKHAISVIRLVILLKCVNQIKDVR